MLASPTATHISIALTASTLQDVYVCVPQADTSDSDDEEMQHDATIPDPETAQGEGAQQDLQFPEDDVINGLEDILVS